MTYELCKQLKEAGFPLREDYSDGRGDFGPFEVCDISSYPRKAYYFFPNLSELIEACGEDNGFGLEDCGKKIGWRAINQQFQHEAFGSTPEEAVARLWLQLNEEDQ